MNEQLYGTKVPGINVWKNCLKLKTKKPCQYSNSYVVVTAHTAVIVWCNVLLHQILDDFIVQFPTKT